MILLTKVNGKKDRNKDLVLKHLMTEKSSTDFSKTIKEMAWDKSLVVMIKEELKNS